MSSKEALTDSSPRLGAVCWGALEGCHLSLPLGPAGTAGGAGKALRGCLSSHPHRELLRRWKEPGRGSVGWPPPRKQKGDKHCVCKHNYNPEPHSGRTGFKPWLYPYEDRELGQSLALAAGGSSGQVTLLASWGIQEAK